MSNPRSGIEFAQPTADRMYAYDWNAIEVLSYKRGEIIPGWSLYIEKQYKQTIFEFSSRVFIRKHGARNIDQTFDQNITSRPRFFISGRIINNVITVNTEDPDMRLVDWLMMERMMSKLGVLER